MNPDNKAIGSHLTEENKKILELIEQKEGKLKKICKEIRLGKAQLLLERQEFEEMKL